MVTDHDHTDIETLAGRYDCVRDLIAERDRLRAGLRVVMADIDVAQRYAQVILDEPGRGDN